MYDDVRVSELISQAEYLTYEIKTAAKLYPGKCKNRLKTLRETLDVLEELITPHGMPESVWKYAIDKIIYLRWSKDRGAMAMYLTNVVFNGSSYILSGVVFHFDTEETPDAKGPGFWIEGSKEKPVSIDVLKLPEYDESIFKEGQPVAKKFKKWIETKSISLEKLNEIVDNFTTIDVSLVSMNSVGLATENKKAPAKKVGTTTATFNPAAATQSPAYHAVKDPVDTFPTVLQKDPPVDSISRVSVLMNENLPVVPYKRPVEPRLNLRDEHGNSIFEEVYD